MKKKMFFVLPKEVAHKLDSIGMARETIKEYEKNIKKAQRSVLSFIKKKKLQSKTVYGYFFNGKYESKVNQRISKTLLQHYLSDDVIGFCTTKSKKFEWVKTSNVSARVRREN